MVILRWNPIQWFGWVLAAVSIVYFLHTGIYGLNSYAGPLADDIRLDVEEYTLSQLVDATTYYRDKANGLFHPDAPEHRRQPEFPGFRHPGGSGRQRLPVT